MTPQSQESGERRLFGLKAWRLRRFHRQCDKHGIPRRVRERMLKAGLTSAPDWYAGPQEARP